MNYLKMQKTMENLSCCSNSDLSACEKCTYFKNSKSYDNCRNTLMKDVYDMFFEMVQDSLADGQKIIELTKRNIELLELIQKMSAYLDIDKLSSDVADAIISSMNEDNKDGK